MKVSGRVNVFMLGKSWIGGFFTMLKPIKIDVYTWGQILWVYLFNTQLIYIKSLNLDS